MSSAADTTLPLALSDDQMIAAMRAAGALCAADRDAFLRRVAQSLAGVADVGDGLLHRTMRSIMSEVLRQRPVIDERKKMPGKYAREFVCKPSKRRLTSS